MSINSDAETVAIQDHKSAMERMYRLQRHIYDVTRAYYLLGRDQMIGRLDPPEGGRILEIGCGTGRNLILAMRRYPSCRLHGIDISEEMLKTACEAVERSGHQAMVRLAQADATDFDPTRTLGHSGFDRIYFSYTLSMVPAWEKALAHAVTLLSANGQLHIVDFGPCDRLLALARKGLYAWLKLFHVTPRKGLREEVNSVAAASGCAAEVWTSHRGYAVHARLTKLT